MRDIRYAIDLLDEKKTREAWDSWFESVEHTPAELDAHPEVLPDDELRCLEEIARGEWKRPIRFSLYQVISRAYAEEAARTAAAPVSSRRLGGQRWRPTDKSRQRSPEPSIWPMIEAHL